MTKHKIGLYPGWNTSTHDTIHRFILENLGFKPMSYKELQDSVSISFREGIKIKIISLFVLIKWILSREKRYGGLYKGIVISHPVIESCLRSSELGQFKLGSYKTFNFIQWAITYLVKLTKFSRNNELGLVLGGDEAYIDGGILAQFARKKHIPAYFFKPYKNMLSIFELDPSTLYAGPVFTNYPALLDKHNINISEWVNELDQIIHNKKNYSYMKEVKYKEKYEPQYFDRIEDCVILYLHDFLDSPGIYGKSIYLDQWKWIETTVGVMTKFKKNLVIKTHPNAFERNKKAIDRLKHLYKDNSNVYFEHEAIPLTFYKKYNVLGFLTIFGSIIRESSFLGLPCISSSNNPAIGFNMSYNAGSIKEYKHYLEKMCLRMLKPKGSKEKAAISFALHEVAYSQNKIAEIPYDDVDNESFNKIFSSFEGVEKFGIEQRREAFLYSVEMREYIEAYLKGNEEEIMKKIRIRLETA